MKIYGGKKRPIKTPLIEYISSAYLVKSIVLVVD